VHKTKIPVENTSQKKALIVNLSVFVNNVCQSSVAYKTYLSDSK